MHTNANKTFSMTIGSRYSILNNHKLELTLDNNEIQTADTFKTVRNTIRSNAHLG